MSPTEFYGTMLALGMAAVVVALLTWQFAEVRRRGVDLSEEDRSHFATQDVRRRVVAGLMTTMAVALYAGSRTSPRLEGRPNLLFIEIWIGTFVLVLVLVGLALLDWLATRRYAQRHRGEIVREGIKILQEEMRTRAGGPSLGRPTDGPDGAPRP